MRDICKAILMGATALAVALAFAPTASAQNKCLSGKTKCVNKKVAGLLKCTEKCQRHPGRCGWVQTACEDKARDKFDGGTKGVEESCFEKLEAKNDGPCVTFDDLTDMEAKADALVSNVVATLEGNLPYSFCGNSVVEGVESCDLADLGGASCTSLGFASGTLACTAGCGYDLSGCASASTTFPATGQTTCWNSSGTILPCADTGHDGDVQAGAPLAYQDNGDGTITDLNTGLMWEKKSDDGSITDWNNSYNWDDAFAVHVATLNSGGGFGGHTDWRVPNVKEMQSIVNYEKSMPAVSPAFNNNCTPGCTVLTCSCTASFFYWSSTTYESLPNGAWVVDFGYGGVDNFYKPNFYYVRVVRGGS